MVRVFARRVTVRAGRPLLALKLAIVRRPRRLAPQALLFIFFISHLDCRKMRLMLCRTLSGVNLRPDAKKDANLASYGQS